MSKIFDLVYRSLKWFEKLTGLTYEELNIIVWYIIIPSIFVYLLDRVLKVNYLKITFTSVVVLSIILIPDFEIFSKNLFKKSVSFLNWFDYLGINYIQASVLICVVLPIVLLALLFYFKLRRKH
ncbi:hypothetical protein FEE95_10780 [Maribacter algarum]|uniref:Uncharacterized protein n=1 Tax=Maribacter algarum (ex Zhang et al. 2020) TaxID=2578118 RepID=A0A5S3PQE1_9FLAO|nr:hypothetical protein [Maribacter algarum]TMM56970.1 hypothetical protein FEE95_10780 [Maribacter algarum]